MGAAASANVRQTDFNISRDRKEVTLAIDNLARAVTVYQHELSGEVLVLVNDDINDIITDGSAGAWLQVKKSPLQNEYFAGIKVSLTSKIKQLGFVEEAKKQDNETVVEKETVVEDLDFEEVDYKADDKRSVYSEVSQSKSQRMFVPKPYMPPGEFYNNMTNDTRVSKVAFAKILARSDAKQPSPNDLQNYQNKKRNQVPTQCRVCGMFFRTVNQELIDEHVDGCASNTSLRKGLEEINTHLGPAKEILHQYTTVKMENILKKAFQAAADQLDATHDPMNWKVKQLLNRVLKVDTSNTFDGRVMDLLNKDCDALLSHVINIIGPSRKDHSEEEKSRREELLNYKVVVEEAHSQLKKKMALLSKFHRRQASIHDYKVLRMLGRGGFASVYLAQRNEDKKLCAIKVMSKKAACEASSELQYLRERKTQAVSGSSYPDYFVRLQCSFTRGDSLFMVMEYIPGGDVMTLLMQQNRLPEHVAQHILAQLCVAVRHMHYHGVVHRDIKPDNLMITNRGHVKLGDFGLAVPYVKDYTFNNKYAQSGSISRAIANQPNPNSNVVFSASGPSLGSYSLNNSVNNYTFDMSLALAHKEVAVRNQKPTTIYSCDLWLDNDSDLTVTTKIYSGVSSSSLFFQKPNEHAKMADQVGNYNYNSPELVVRSGYDHTADWWAVGVLFYHLMAGITPFEGLTKAKTVENIVLKPISFDYMPSEVSDGARDLIEGCVRKAPKNRIGYQNSEDVLKHPYFDGLDWGTLFHGYGPYYPLIEGSNGTDFLTFTTLTEDEANDIPDYLDSEEDNNEPDDFNNWDYHVLP